MRIQRLRNTLTAVLLTGLAVSAVSFAGGVYLRFRTPKLTAPTVVRESPQAGSADALLASAERLLRERKTEQSIVAYQQVIALKPDSMEAQLGLAKGELLAGREKIAIQEYERVLRFDPNHRESLLALAGLYSHRRSTWPQSESRYRRYLKLVPRDAADQLALACNLAWQGKAGAAAELFSRPEVVPLETASDVRDYAFCLSHIGKYEQAEPVLRKLMSLTPGDTAAAMQLARIYARRKNWQSALPL